ncbi:hypothetical protein AALO_G00154890, partial [Alosa alosa]
KYCCYAKSTVLQREVFFYFLNKFHIDLVSRSSPVMSGVVNVGPPDLVMDGGTGISPLGEICSCNSVSSGITYALLGSGPPSSGSSEGVSL